MMVQMRTGSVLILTLFSLMASCMAITIKNKHNLHTRKSRLSNGTNFTTSLRFPRGFNEDMCRPHPNTPQNSWLRLLIIRCNLLLISHNSHVQQSTMSPTKTTPSTGVNWMPSSPSADYVDYADVNYASHAAREGAVVDKALYSASLIIFIMFPIALILLILNHHSGTQGLWDCQIH